MAHVSQELKARLSPRVRALLAEYGLKGSLSVRNHSTLVLTVQQGPIDFISDYNRVAGERYSHMGRFQPAQDNLDVNIYHYRDHFSGPALEFLRKVVAVMNDGNHDHSDIQSDYFDVGWYVDIKIGKWNKPYALVK
jgi:hypothetical protein